MFLLHNTVSCILTPVSRLIIKNSSSQNAKNIKYRGCLFSFSGFFSINPRYLKPPYEIIATIANSPTRFNRVIVFIIFIGWKFMSIFVLSFYLLD